MGEGGRRVGEGGGEVKGQWGGAGGMRGEEGGNTLVCELYPGCNISPLVFFPPCCYFFLFFLFPFLLSFLPILLWSFVAFKRSFACRYFRK